MKKNLITAIFLIANTLLIGQNVKTYSGDFEKGKANYQYYENDNYDRIFNGSFSYIGALYDMSGTFKNGNKDGKWLITSKDKKFTGYSGTIITRTNIHGVYKDGNLNGDWIYENSLRFSNSTLADADNEFSKASFLDNHFIGKITYTSNWPETTEIDGQFDNEGYMSGKWLFITGTIKDEIRFNNGVAYWRVIVDTTNGDKLKFYDNTLFVKSFWDNYDSKNNLSIINEKAYYIKTVNINSSTRVPDYGILPPSDPHGAYKEDYNPICIWANESISLFRSSSLSNPLYYYKLGSNPPVGYQKMIMECDYGTECYNFMKAKQTKLRVENLIKNGDKLLESKKFRNALIEFLTAKELDKTNILVIEKIDLIQKEIDKIENLHKNLSKIYSQIKDNSNNDRFEYKLLYSKLLADKKIMAENYDKCMSLLSNNFVTYFSQIDSLLSTNKMKSSENFDAWTANDQLAYDEILKFQEELTEFENFHNSVKTAFESTNKEKLKMLKSNSDPKIIIGTFTNN